VLTSVSFINPSSTGVLDHTSRWLSRSSTACIADVLVRMCVLAMVLVRWLSTCVASPPSSSARAKQTWSIASHALRSSMLIFHPSLSLSHTRYISISTVQWEGKRTYANGMLRSTGPPPIPPRVSSISPQTHARLVRGRPCTSSRPWVSSHCACPRTNRAVRRPTCNLLRHQCAQAPRHKAWRIVCACRVVYLSPPWSCHYCCICGGTCIVIVAIAAAVGEALPAANAVLFPAEGAAGLALNSQVWLREPRLQSPRNCSPG